MFMFFTFLTVFLGSLSVNDVGLWPRYTIVLLLQTQKGSGFINKFLMDATSNMFEPNTALTKASSTSSPIPPANGPCGAGPVGWPPTQRPCFADLTPADCNAIAVASFLPETSSQITQRAWRPRCPEERHGQRHRVLTAPTTHHVSRTHAGLPS